MNPAIKRLKRFALIVRCVAVFFFRGRADKTSKTYSNIIVVLTGKLGDIVCGTPVLRAIRARLPAARIIVAGGSRLQCSVLSDSGLVDEYLDLGEKRALARIKESRAEAALITGPSFESTALLFCAGISLVVGAKVEGGFSPSETRPYKILQRFITTFPYHIKGYAPRERLKVLEPLGIFSDDTKKHLGFSETAGEKVKQFLSGNNLDEKRDFIVGVSPSAGNKIKEWPEERFARIVDYLTATYQAKVIIIGGPNDKEKVKKTVGHLKFSAKVWEITDFSIDELKALIAKLRLFIATDTGPIYVAEAFNIPTIDIVGPVDENVQPPRGLIHRNVVPPDRKKPELSILNARAYDKEEALRQVLSITAEAVTAKIDGLIRDVYGLRPTDVSL